MNQKGFFVLHILPLLFAITLAAVIYFVPPLDRMFFPFDPPVKGLIIPDSSTHSYANYNGGYPTELNMRSALRKGCPIVLLGSSELARNDLRAMPYNFYGRNLSFPCLGMGHAGNQSLSIAVQLAAMHEGIEQSKLVIMISPGWFFDHYADGTSLESFLEFANERFLYYIWYDEKVPQEFKDHLGDHVVKHFKDIDSPSSILRLIYYSRTGDANMFRKVFNSPFTVLHRMYTRFKTNAMDGLYDRSLATAPFSKRDFAGEDIYGAVIRNEHEPNWDSLSKDALDRFELLSNNNAFGVENAYYDQYMKGRSELKHLDLKPIEDNTEFKDLQMLFAVLKKFNAKPLFIIQPLNPYTHKDLAGLDPTINAIVQELDKNNFEYLNLYTSEKEEYVKGTLADVMHMGDHGWYLADKKIYEYFLKNKK